jgi:hypothetical protein
MYYLAEDLINSIKVRTLAPISQVTFSDDNILMFANEQVMTSLVPLIMGVREDFMSRFIDYPLVANQEFYLVPERCVGDSLKDVIYIDSNGGLTPLPRYDSYDLPVFGLQGMMPYGFYMNGDYVGIMPSQNSPTGKLRLWYYTAANKIVPTIQCAKITSVTVSGNNTVYAVNNDISGLAAVGSLVDCVAGRSPFVNRVENATVVAIDASSITVATSDLVNIAGVANPSVGDYWCVAQTTPIPQLPKEFHPVLAQEVAVRLMEGLADEQKMAAANATLTQMKQAMFNLITPRVENAPEQFTNRNSLAAFSGTGWPSGMLIRR